MAIENKKVALLYLTVICGYLLVFIASTIHQLQQPYTGEPYYLQEGE